MTPVTAGWKQDATTVLGSSASWIAGTQCHSEWWNLDIHVENVPLGMPRPG